MLPKFASISTNSSLKLKLDMKDDRIAKMRYNLIANLDLEPLFRGHYSKSVGKCL